MRARGRRRGSRLSIPSGPTLLRLLLTAFFAAGAGWLSVAATGASILRENLPDAALTFAPWDASARAGAAETLLFASPQGAISRDAVRRADGLARQALERDATVVSAWRTLAMTARSNEQAQLLFSIANSLSRRDLPTQMWLIEDAVRRNDIPGALGHYDIALRSATSAQQILLPILVNATGERAIVPPLAALLRSTPPWRSAFLDMLADTAPNPENEVLLIRMSGKTDSRDEGLAMVRALNRLVETGAFLPGMHLYETLSGTTSSPQPLRNGQFSHANPFPPFDWLLQDTGDISAGQRPAPAPATGQALYVRSAADSQGEAARQILLLAPGRYSLRAVSGGIDAPAPEQANWKIVCAGQARQPLLSLDAKPSGGERRDLQAIFMVPLTGCGAQWLTLEISAGNQPGGTGIWAGDVRIEPLPL